MQNISVLKGQDAQGETVVPLHLFWAPVCKMLGWINHKLESKIAGRNINNLRYADDTTLMAESEEELENLLGEREE